ncbi:MAG TPA: cysteine--tRNA ligase [Gemmatimonadales bacterium]|nr:cysteine--tRNA ligase [Gemmatimonadales bacterium]
MSPPPPPRLSSDSPAPLLVVDDVAARLVRRGLLAPAEAATPRWRRAQVLVFRQGHSYVSAAPMTLALYNTLTRQVEPFAPLAPPRVTLYTCGPTVWNHAHIGNFRTFLFEDLLRRYLEYSGYAVFHIMNLTDVDDRTIKAAAAAGKRLEEHTAPFVQAFFEDRDYLRIKPAHVYPRATQSVPAMIRLVERLLERGVAYQGDDGSIYFAIDKFPRYGRLSRLDARELKVGARVASDEYAKDDPRDFALWKKAEPLDEQVGAAWDAPFGRGRPGWHLECSAMSLEQIGKCCHTATLDIHAGGVDLIFPHHEDEIAQSEAATGQTFARFWLHGEFLNVRGTKMSKRFGNFLTARDLRDQGVDAAALRLLLWQTHYRKALDFADEALVAAGAAVRRLGEFYDRLGTAGQGKGEEVLARASAKFEADFRAALDDDLNAPRACAALFDFVHEGNATLDAGAGGTSAAAAARAVLERVMGVLDVLPTARTHDPSLVRWVEDRIAARDKARKAKDFKEADRIRAELLARGVEIDDTPSGTKWRLA